MDVTFTIIIDNELPEVTALNFKNYQEAYEISKKEKTQFTIVNKDFFF